MKSLIYPNRIEPKHLNKSQKIPNESREIPKLLIIKAIEVKRWIESGPNR